MDTILDSRLPKSGYQYFDTPDGEDCLKKLIVTVKKSGLFGILVSSLDCLLYSHPKGFPAILTRYAYITFPLIGMGAAFTATTCAAVNIRKKDDQLNYALGGIATAAVGGAWKQSYRIGIYGGLGLAAFAAVIKDCFLNNWVVLEEFDRKQMIDPLYFQRDFSLMEDPGRTWRRS